MPVLTKKTNTNPSHSASHHDKGNESFFGVQAKLNIGKSNDKFEVEADRVADQVAANKQTASPDNFFSPSPVVQKKLAGNVQKQEEQNKGIQRKTALQTITPIVQLKEEVIQNKLDSRITEKREINPAFSASKTLIQKKEETIQNKKEAKKTEIVSTTNFAAKPLIQNKNKGEDENIQQKKEEEKQAKDDEKQIQKNAGADANPSDNSNLESNLNSSKGGGSPLSGKVKTEMESGIGADFSNVRIHNDSNAIQMNKQLGAQAFATGNNIYFNEGKYNPNSQDGKHLLAHELTHTVQQGAAIRKKPEPVSPAPEMIQGSFLDLVPNWIIDQARHIPGYTLFTVIIGYDPLRQIDVERTPINLVEGLMGLIPFGTAIFDKLQEYGILQQVFDWVEGKLGELGLTIDSILDMVEDVWDKVSFPYTDIIDLVTEKFEELVNRITSFVSATVDQVITWIKEALINVAEPILAENKAWSLIKKIIKYDPLRDEAVNATTVEILEDFLILIDKQTELEQMREKGTLQKTADWLDTQVGTFNSLLGELRGLITAAWDAIQPSNLANIADNLSALADQVGGFLQRVWDFASGVALKVLELVKDSLLGWLSDQAKTVRGYSLIKVIIGKDPFTQEAVPRTIPNLIRGFMSLMDGGEEQYAQMVETGAIARIAGEIEAAVATLNMTPQSIIQLFTDIWGSMTIDDLVNPIDAFMRIIEKFGEPIDRLIAFVAEIIRIVIVAILEIMNFPFDLIGNIITRALEAIDDIKKDPIGFLKNILRALKQGFVQFFDNIITHLINGVTGWLMSELKDANIPVLTDFSLKGVITWVMEVLNISMEKIWEKLAAHPRIGPARVAKIRSMINTLEGIWTFIKDVQERGMAAIWDKIQEQLSNLWNTVLDAVKNFVMERIVNRVTAKLLSMLDPTGIMAVINGAMAFFNAIQSFIKYLREMLEVVNSFVNGVADLARGNVATAADYLERTMGQAMPVVIGFLANQVGLTGIGARVGEMLIAVRQMVDEALTWLVNQAVDRGMALLDRVMAMGANARDAIFGWLGFNTPVTFSNGENHTMKIEEQNGQRVINIYSQKQRFEDFLNTKQTEAQAAPDSPQKTEKLTKISNVRLNYNAANVVIGELYALENATPATPAATKQTKERELRDKLKLIKDDLQSLGLAPGQNAITTHFQVASKSNGRPTLVKADPLTTLPGNTVGSAPGRGANFPPGWDHLTLLDRASLIDIRSWNRMHLIADRLHGSGSDPDNLVPADNSVNTPAAQIEQRALNKLRDPANADKVLKYETKVDYHPTPMQNFPSNITIEWQECSVTPTGQTTPIGSVDRWASGLINPPPSLTSSGSSGPAILNLRSASISEFIEVFGRGVGRRLQLAYSRRFLSNLPYSPSSLNTVYGILAGEGTNSMKFSSNVAATDFTLLSSKSGTPITIGTTTYTIQI
ncbi:eCIS core domain-containing protein [Flavobacterium hibisci]|uniref:eCIS core domain-containing protein n=1 Tax=Flavobacterium hibisci TaxID=1914462 RepID=UPI001CC190A1|nr:DUF4157 domain-containing protein [Flavobacterium hibisci]